MNKKIVQLSMFAFVLIALNWASCTSEPSSENTSDSTATTATNESTQSAETVEAATYFVPAELPINYGKENILADKIYPIGWSNDSKFAYIVEPADEATGFYFINIIIQDLNNDKILWSFVYDTEDQIENKDLKATWKEQFELIKSKLDEHKIVQEKSFILEKLKFAVDNNNFEVKLTAKKGVSVDFAPMEVIEKYTLKITSALGQKQIFSKKEESSRMLDAKVLGVFKSPYENKIAVLVASENFGYEGPPNVVGITVVGANLDSGFKK